MEEEKVEQFLNHGVLTALVAAKSLILEKPFSRKVQTYSLTQHFTDDQKLHHGLMAAQIYDD